ncbi:MAG TPA: RHS repeat-associated core domain-containing protein [Verrucomicrobiota bacterium]|nr:RHS repeat-associated core domain-containing protein [Verrucomicrobiota bacterium]
MTGPRPRPKTPPLGQLPGVVYPVSPALTLQYDVLGRLTNLVDGVGQTRYSYANNRLASEDGPWAEDTVSYSYQYAGPRSGLTLLQPNASPWTQSYGYDAAERLTSVASPGGAFGYAYDSTRVALPGTLTLPNGATIATSYDFMARLTNTTLRSSQSAVLNHHGYGYNAASQRTSVTNLAGNTVAYRYDRSGQLTQASGKEANGTTRLNEQFGYGYDDENQLITVIVTNGVNNSTLSRFAYDGFGRRRVRTECVWQNGGWATNALVRYVYDGMVVLQERDGNNLPTATYTRGRDLSGGLQGAGGIGGLLALTLHSSLPTPHFFYHADGNGNVTCLINEKHAVVARYVYEPFGNVVSMSGPLAEVNLYRFSSKEAHPVTGLVYYGFRFYDPNLQRWVNRDPIEEDSGGNLYEFCYGAPVVWADPDGLAASDFSLCVAACWLGFKSVAELTDTYWAWKDPSRLPRHVRRQIELEVRHELTGSWAKPTQEAIDELIKCRAKAKLRKEVTKRAALKGVKTLGPNIVPGVGSIISVAMNVQEAGKAAWCAFKCARGRFPLR